jgi:prepilin-type N-terminal cleavage/methylation domain-containing protein
MTITVEKFESQIPEAASRSGADRSAVRFARKGFTMMEILVVMLIVAVLAAVLITVISNFRSRAYSARCTSNLRQLGSVMGNCQLPRKRHISKLEV